MSLAKIVDNCKTRDFASEVIPVQHSPGYLSWVALEVMSPLSFSRQKFIGFSVAFDHCPAMTGVNFKPREGAQFELHNLKSLGSN